MGGKRWREKQAGNGGGRILAGNCGGKILCAQGWRKSVAANGGGRKEAGENWRESPTTEDDGYRKFRGVKNGSLVTFRH